MNAKNSSKREREENKNRIKSTCLCFNQHWVYNWIWVFWSCLLALKHIYAPRIKAWISCKKNSVRLREVWCHFIKQCSESNKRSDFYIMNWKYQLLRVKIPDANLPKNGISKTFLKDIQDTRYKLKKKIVRVTNT